MKEQSWEHSAFYLLAAHRKTAFARAHAQWIENNSIQATSPIFIYKHAEQIYKKLKPKNGTGARRRMERLESKSSISQKRFTLSL